MVVVENSTNQSERSNFLNFVASQKVPVRILYPGRNLGFTQSHNLSMGAESEWDYVVIANDDIEIPSQSANWLTKMTEFLHNNPQVGSVSPITVMRSGRIYYAGISGEHRHRLGGARYNPKLMDKPYKTQWNNMAMCMISREKIEEVGMLDIRRPHYGSDEEWCRRATQIGQYEHWVLPILIYHYHRECRRVWPHGVRKQMPRRKR